MDLAGAGAGGGTPFQVQEVARRSHWAAGLAKVDPAGAGAGGGAPYKVQEVARGFLLSRALHLNLQLRLLLHKVVEIVNINVIHFLFIFSSLFFFHILFFSKNLVANFLFIHTLIRFPIISFFLF